jgi:hypothetical protein
LYWCFHTLMLMECAGSLEAEGRIISTENNTTGCLMQNIFIITWRSEYPVRTPVARAEVSTTATHLRDGVYWPARVSTQYDTSGKPQRILSCSLWLHRRATVCRVVGWLRISKMDNWIYSEPLSGYLISRGKGLTWWYQHQWRPGQSPPGVLPSMRSRVWVWSGQQPKACCCTRPARGALWVTAGEVA